MKFADYWLKALKRNPKLVTAAKIQMTPEALENLCKDAYEQGFKDGKEAEPSLFESVFGKRS